MTRHTGDARHELALGTPAAPASPLPRTCRSFQGPQRSGGRRWKGKCRISTRAPITCLRISALPGLKHLGVAGPPLSSLGNRDPGGSRAGPSPWCFPGQTPGCSRLSPGLGAGEPGGPAKAVVRRILGCRASGASGHTCCHRQEISSPSNKLGAGEKIPTSHKNSNEEVRGRSGRRRRGPGCGDENRGPASPAWGRPDRQGEAGPTPSRSQRAVGHLALVRSSSAPSVCPCAGEGSAEQFPVRMEAPPPALGPGRPPEPLGQALGSVFIH